jgi:hypothetical protein
MPPPRVALHYSVSERDEGSAVPHADYAGSQADREIPDQVRSDK